MCNGRSIGSLLTTILVVLIGCFAPVIFASDLKLRLYKSVSDKNLNSPQSPITPPSPNQWKSSFSKGIFKPQKIGKNKIETLFNLLKEQYSKEKLSLQKKSKKFTIEEESSVYCALHNTLAEFIEKNKNFSLEKLVTFIAKKQEIPAKDHNKNVLKNSADKRYTRMSSFLRKVPRVIAWVVLNAYCEEKIKKDPFFWGKDPKILSYFEDIMFPFADVLQCKKLYQAEDNNKGTVLSNNNSWAVIKNNEVVFYSLDGNVIHKKPLQAKDISGGSSTPKDISFDPSGRGLVVSQQDGRVMLWDVSTETPSAVATLVSKNPQKVLAFSMSLLSQKMIMKINDKYSYFVKRIALKGKQKNVSISDGEPFNSKIPPVLSPNGRYIAYGFDNKICVKKACDIKGLIEKQESAPSNINGMNSASKKEKDSSVKIKMYYEGLFDCLTFDPQSQYLLFGRRSRHSPDTGYIKILKIDDNFISPEMKYSGHIFHKAFSVDGTSFSLVCGDGKSICLCNLEEGTNIKLSEHKEPITKIAFNISGSRLYASSLDGMVTGYSTEDGSVVTSLKHDLPVVDFVVSGFPPFETLLTKTKDQSVWRWGGDIKEYSLPSYLVLKNAVPDSLLSFTYPAELWPFDPMIWPLEKDTQKKINSEFKQAGLKNEVVGFSCKPASWSEDESAKLVNSGFFYLTSGTAED